MKEEKFITQTAVEQFKLLDPLLDGLYFEFQEFSKKKPETSLNTNKVKMVNRILQPIKELLNDEPVSEYLDILDIDALSNNSDVILILSHYKKAMDMFKSKYYDNIGR